MVQDLLRDAEDRMRKTRDVLSRELAGIRTGRASPALVEELRVDYYGTPTPLKQIASITAPEPKLLLIQPWDRTAIPHIERAILKSDLGVTPANDGTILRLNIPALTEQRRRDLAKLVRKRVEEDRIALRNVRRDTVEHMRRLLKDKQISEDDERRSQEQLQKVTERILGDVEKLGAAKEAEVMEV